MSKHAERKHALLSASKAEQWMACTPSARLQDRYGKESTSDFAREGTLAHEISEHLLRNDTDVPPEHLTREQFYSEEMLEFCIMYANFVRSLHQEALLTTPDAELIVEDKVDLTSIIPEGFGTCDTRLVADYTLTIVDLKYGLGVRVDAFHNEQLMLYAYGALLKVRELYNVEKVRMFIHQPRLDAISEYEISADELTEWAKGDVRAKAKLAYAGKGELQAGSHCKFCKVKAKCRAYNAKILDGIENLDTPPELLTDKEFSKVLAMAPDVQDWVKTLSDYAYSEALKGKKFTGFKLVAGKARRKWQDEVKALEALQGKGFLLKDLTNTEIKGIGDVEKLALKVMTKVEREDLIATLTIKSTPPLKLVPESDKGVEVDPLNTALEDFSDFIINS